MRHCLGVAADDIFGSDSREAMVAAMRGQGVGNRPTEAQHGFIDRMASAMHAGNDHAMRQALDDYLKTPAGQGWQRQAPVAVDEPQPGQQRDPDGPSR